jgi:hypothetical protein
LDRDKGQHPMETKKAKKETGGGLKTPQGNETHRNEGGLKPHRDEGGLKPHERRRGTETP